jgi:hypothetical protein
LSRDFSDDEKSYRYKWQIFDILQSPPISDIQLSERTTTSTR